jgi:hypothetical protein
MTEDAKPIEVATTVTDTAKKRTVTEAAVRSGRRWSDWHVIESNGRSLFFWIFGMFLDDRHKPSMSRCMLAFWTYAGWLCIRHELLLKAGQPSLQNAVWTAWWAAEGVLAFAVFGPSIASYFGAGAAGAVTGMAASIREQLQKVLPKTKEKDE